MVSMLQPKWWARSLENFSWVHDPIGVEDVLDLLHEADANLALGVRQRVGLHRTDTMFCRDRAAERFCSQSQAAVRAH